MQEFEKGSKDWPLVGVIGIAGAVENNEVDTTNVRHWPKTKGREIAERFGMKSFELVNDFVAAGQ